MRQQTVLTILALVASTLVFAPPAQGRPPLGRPPLGPDTTPDRASQLICPNNVHGVDSSGRLTFDIVTNAVVSTSTRSEKKVGFKVTAIGYIETDKERGILRFDAVTRNGTPREVTSTLTTQGQIGLARSRRFAQSGFQPRLFADNLSDYAFTVDRAGKLARWLLVRRPNGTTKFAKKVVLGGGFGDLTSLQSTDTYVVKGTDSEVLYATTSTGALLQIVVPVDNPQSFKAGPLAETGYEGVTELAWTYCNNTRDFHSLIAIDAAAATATWTIIKKALSKPESQLRGEVIGSEGWDLVGAF